MTKLKLVYGPSPNFKQISVPVEEVDDNIRELCEGLKEMLYAHGAVGIAATMVGVHKRVMVADLQENDEKNPFSIINPKITFASEELQTFEEGSICFPGVSAEITRPKSIKVEYLDEDGNSRNLEAEGFLSTVIQHEIDYMDGKTYLDYLSPMKRSLLLKRTRKYTQKSGY
ncbi:MAG: peptide deformylase [Emcibacteraceae bacterium]